MQPDFPEPVVPAMRMCGIRARSAETDAPEMSFPSQTESGLDERRQLVEDVAERDDVRGEVRHLDADRLLAGDRREDADLGGRERVGEVVLERRDLADLRAGRELELVAGHARADDLADERRVDPEVGQRLQKRRRRALGRLAGLALVRARAPEDARRREGGSRRGARSRARRRAAAARGRRRSRARARPRADRSSWSTSTGWRCGVSPTTSG